MPEDENTKAHQTWNRITHCRPRNKLSVRQRTVCQFGLVPLLIGNMLSEYLSPRPSLIDGGVSCVLVQRYLVLSGDKLTKASNSNNGVNILRITTRVRAADENRFEETVTLPRCVAMLASCSTVVPTAIPSAHRPRFSSIWFFTR